MGMVKTLVVFNLLLIDLDLALRVLLTITCVLSTIVFILSVRIDKMIQKLAQVSSITVV